MPSASGARPWSPGAIQGWARSGPPRTLWNYHDQLPRWSRGRAPHAMNSSQVEIWTDGACKGNPGLGGWGALLRQGRHEKAIYGGEVDTTNNRMELMAVIEALKALKRPCEVVVHTDSQYVQKGMSEWLANWKRRGWLTADKKPVKNADLWQELDALVARHFLQWRWVRGHAGDAGNERADQLANLGVEQARMHRSAQSGRRAG